VLGSLLGSRIGKKLSAATLRRSFAWLILFMGAFILVRETPDDLLQMPAIRAGGALALLVVVGAALRNFRIGMETRQINGTESAGHASKNAAPESGTRGD